MTKPIATKPKPNPKTAWLKELHTGQEHSIWRISGEIIDDVMKDARKLLDKAGLPYTARDVLRLTAVGYKVRGLLDGIEALAKARLECEALPYAVADLIEMIALLSECMERTGEIMEEEDDHIEVCADCAGQARH